MKLPATAARFVHYEEIPFGERWVVGPGDKRQGQRGVAIATIGFKHATGYEVILHLDDGRQDSFAPMQLFPEKRA